MIKNPKYIAGISYVVIGILIKPFIDMLLPMSTAAVLSAQSIICTYIIEYIFAARSMDYKLVISLVLIFLGICVGTYSANIVDGIYSIDDIRHMFINVNTIVTTAVIVALLVGSRQILAYSAGGMKTSGGLFLSVTTAGVVAGWFATSMKAVMELFKYTFLHGMDSISFGNLWLWLLALLVAALFTIKMNVVEMCLIEYPPAQFLPLYQVI